MADFERQSNEEEEQQNSESSEKKKNGRWTRRATKFKSEADSRPSRQERVWEYGGGWTRECEIEIKF